MAEARLRLLDKYRKICYSVYIINKMKYMDQKHDYLSDYNTFLSTYHRGQVSGEEVGEVIAKMASHFALYNMLMVNAERSLSLVARDIESRTDESSGKAITSAKAKTFIDATDESNAYNMARAHVQNIEQFLNALKSLQKGVLNEYSYAGAQ